MTNRLFIGLDLPESTIEYITNLRNEIYGSSNNIKWEGEDKLHITIKFLGDVGENLLELIKDRLENIELFQIEAELNGFNFFVKNNNPSILYIAWHKSLPRSYRFRFDLSQQEHNPSLCRRSSRLAHTCQLS